MTKYSLDFKLQTVKNVIENGITPRALGKQVGVDESIIRHWVNLFKCHGLDGLKHIGASYTGEYKIYVIEYMHSNKMSLRSTCAHFNIRTHGTVSEWERIYYEKGPTSLLENKPRGRPPKMNMTKPKNPLPKGTEEDLIAEVQRLRMENEYLKKLQALVQERIAREKGKEPPSSKN